ncbi:hypothetical protein BPT24_112 [Tenacibaculum phage pT24]|uniref:Uncharacterized protein n=1 Tax=Tenacibaculum phage pT24 TaxID=1880590 RepID=A0A1B4XWR2_9CAUD|nr:hypothetical protein HYP10_gp112 [Tenacibaculum phage pT24]BAV39237.1 hypothetical protein BPT24_112 [Tenacibaculum phage pT24]
MEIINLINNILDYLPYTMYVILGKLAFIAILVFGLYQAQRPLYKKFDWYSDIIDFLKLPYHQVRIYYWTPLEEVIAIYCKLRMMDSSIFTYSTRIMALFVANRLVKKEKLTIEYLDNVYKLFKEKNKHI